MKIQTGMEMKRETERDRRLQVLSGQTFTVFEDARTVSAQDVSVTANLRSPPSMEPLREVETLNWWAWAYDRQSADLEGGQIQ